MTGSGFRAQGSGLRDQGSGIEHQGSSIGDLGSKLRTQGSGMEDRVSRLFTPDWLLCWLWRFLCHNLIRLWWSQWHLSRRCLGCHGDRGLALTGCSQHLFLIIALKGKQDLKEKSSSIHPAMIAGSFSGGFWFTFTFDWKYSISPRF